MSTTPVLKNFLEIPYDELELLNLEAKQKMLSRSSDEEFKEYYLKYLQDQKQLKAVTLCFTDIEGRFHMLDYDKKYLLKSYENLTFDGSSIRGFSQVSESDLRLQVDWGTFRWLPSDVFGPGKVIVFGLICDRDGKPYPSDMRGRLKEYTQQLFQKEKITAHCAVECEGFLVEGLNAEQNYNSREGFKLVSSGGYFNSLPRDPLKLFIDTLAEAQRALGFENEKDHPEVAPSQFELNYSYCDALIAADQVQLYKLTARQIAANMKMTACFLPKPIRGINGSGMHTNISLAENGKNLFYSAKGKASLSTKAWKFIERILSNANDLCLALNPSVNAYRRLDPHFEAPNQIKSSAVDRTSMIRIPIGNERSARIEVRTVAPDANPYLIFFLLLRTGNEGAIREEFLKGAPILPDNIYTAMDHFQQSELIREFFGKENQEKFIARKVASANRCPRELGTLVKTEEVLFHHEVTNQYLWSQF
ncbi:MAG: glutamine synthetase family protein [Planctomycetota bacterium]